MGRGSIDLDCSGDGGATWRWSELLLGLLAKRERERGILGSGWRRAAVWVAPVRRKEEEKKNEGKKRKEKEKEKNINKRKCLGQRTIQFISL